MVDSIQPAQATGLAVAAYNPTINECIYQSHDMDMASLDIYLS